MVLEDTNRDGKADKLTVFASGFDALDGVAFTADGVLVSNNPATGSCKTPTVMAAPIARPSNSADWTSPTRTTAA